MHRLPAATARRLLAATVLTLVATACNRGDAAARWEGTIDTLANGAVLVRSPEAGLWKPGQEWKLEEEFRIGSVDAEGPELFGGVGDIEVDPLGRIWVLEQQANELRVFNPDGTHLRTIGRKGGGPGEFEDIIGLAWAPDGNLWVVDPGNARYTVIDTAGRLVTSHRRAVGGYSMPWEGGFDREGRFHEITSAFNGNEVRRVAIRFDTAMAPRDTVELPRHDGRKFELRKENSYTSAVVPFTPAMVTHLTRDGDLWSGVSDRYRIHRHRLGGDTVRVVERPFQPVPVTAAERDTAIGRLKWFTEQGGRVDRSQIPGTKPAFTAVFTDDEGNLWVRPSTPPQDENRVFDMFDAEGRYLGEVRTPFAVTWAPVFRNGRLYTVTADEMDVQYVVGARIVKPR